MPISSPEDISDLKTWLDISDPACVTESGGWITQLDDLSATGAPAFSLIVGNGAPYDPTGYNGKPTMRVIAGSDNGIQMPGGDPSPHSNPSTEVIFWQPQESITTTTRIVDVVSDLTKSFRIAATSNNGYQVRSGGTNTTHTLAITPTTPTILFLKISDAEIVVDAVDVVDGVAQPVRSSAPAASVAGVSGGRLSFGRSAAVGNSNSWQLMSMLIYDKTLSDAERGDVVDYLVSHWALPSGDLSNGVVTPTETGATATVDSATDQGTLYMAVRTSGPYGEGDEADIVNAVGAIYDENKTPAIGTNTFNVTGLTADTPYHCGFTIETADPATGYELDVTTEGAGVFTVSRVGNAIGVADNDDLHIVGQDKLVLVGGAHNGTDFAAPCVGLLTHPPSTNTLQWSGGTAYNYRDAWNDGAGSINAATETLLGDFYLCTPYYTSNSPSQLYLAKGQDGTSYSGPWTWTIYVVKGTAPGFSMEINNNRGTANYAWNGTVPELQSVEDGAVSWAYHVIGNIWAVVLVAPSTSNQWKNVHFYPDMKGNTVVSGQYTSFFGGQLVDKGFADSIIHPMSNEDSITVNSNQPVATLANMGVPDISGDFTVEYKFKIYVDNLNQSLSRNLFCLFGDADNKIHVYFIPNSRQLKVAFIFGGVAYYRTMSDILPDQEHSLIIRGDTATGTIARWLNGVKNNWTGIMGTFAAPVSLLKLGSSTADDSDNNVMPHIMTGMKLYDGALDDTTIEGWL